MYSTSSYGHSPTMTAMNGPHRSNESSAHRKFLSSPPFGNFQQHDLLSPSEAFEIQISNGVRGDLPESADLDTSIKPSLGDEPCEDPRSDSIYVDCSVGTIDNWSGACFCQSIVLAPTLRLKDRTRLLSEALRHTRRNHLLEQTGVWLFESDTFNKWREMGRSSVLWLVSSPGKGKSMLCSAVLEKLDNTRRSGDIVTFHFFDGRFDASEAILAVLMNLVNELLSRKIDPQSQDRLTTLAVDLASFEDELSAPELQRFLSTIQHTLGQHETLFIILDGLDWKSPSESGHSLLYTFLDFLSFPNIRHRIKALVSSRHHYDPSSRLGGVLRVDIDQQGPARADMELYVHKRAQKLRILNPSADVDKLTAKLKSDPDATFLSAGLMLRNLQKMWDSLDSSVYLFNTSLTSGLSATYSAMLSRIMEKDMAKSLLKWAVYSARPLSLEEVPYVLLTATTVTEGDIWRISGGLLAVGKRQTVNFVHLTARDYLLSLSEDNVYWMGTSSMAHEVIVRACLKALSPIELLEALNLLTAAGSQSSIIRTRSMFVYARQYLLFHYRRGELCSNSLPGLLHSCLKKSMESHDFSMYAKSLTTLQEVQSLQTCGTISSRCMMSGMILKVAANFGLEKLARLELQMGGNAHITCRPRFGAALQPLHLAAKGGHLDVVKILLQYGADHMALSDSGCTPLYYAAAKGSSDIMRLLLLQSERPWSCTIPRTHKRSLLLARAIQYMHEPLYLVGEVSDTCALCCDKKAHYIISKPRQYCQDSNLWRPIHVPGDFIPSSDFALSSSLCSNSSQKFSTDGEEDGKRAIIKWFAGAEMYHALGIAAKRGMETVKELLLVADNDTNRLKSFTSISELLCKLRLS